MSVSSEDGYQKQIRFWTNDLIWDEITRYLSISDLKALRVVNKDLYNRVRKNRRFLYTRIITSSSDNNAKPAYKAIVDIARARKYAMKLEQGSLSFINVRYLELTQFEELPRESRNQMLKVIICRCKNLKSLVVETETLFYDNNQNFLEDAKVKSIFSQLEELQIGRKNSEQFVDDYIEDNRHVNLGSPESVPSACLETRRNNSLANFKLFPSHRLKLKKVIYHDPAGDGNYPTFFLPALIMGTSFNTLVEIHLSLNKGGLKTLRYLNIPNLAIFELETKRFENADLKLSIKKNLIPFIRNHVHNLKAFSFSSLQNNFSLKDFCNSFHSSTKIQSLSFKGSFTSSIRTIDVGFLQTLSTLRSFKLKNKNQEEEIILPWTPRAASDVWLRYLVNLPSKVTSISLYDFRHEDSSQTLPITLKNLERFKDLTELSMLRCTGFLLNDTLQLICSHLRKLRALKADFNEITDYGITGCRPDGTHSGISLKNLKGLKSLTMSSEGAPWKITWKGLLNSIEFLELVQLFVNGTPVDAKLDGNELESVDGYNYLQLIRQNPTLEMCNFSFYKPTCWFRECAKKSNPRIKPELIRYF